MAARAIFHGGLGLADLSLHEIPGEWRKAIADGCDWKVIKAVVWKEFPQLLDLVCQSGNTNQSISKQEDELQLINKVKQAITSWPGASAPKWQDVSATVLRSRPKCGPCAPSIFAFVVRFGGSSKMLADTQAYARTCGKGGRELGQETWAILSQEMKSFPDHLRWRHALLKYAYSGVMPITATDAKRAMTNKEVVQKASCAMKLLDQWAAVTEPYANDETKQLVFQRAHGSLEVHLAACALDKKNRTHDKMEDAARQVLQDFANEIGVALATPSQWGQTQKKPSPKQPPSTNTILREYNDKGVLTNAPAVMASMGFAVGSQVQRGSTVAKIDRVQGDEVRLTVEDSKVFVSAASFIANEWKQYSEPKPQLEVTWLQHSPPSSLDFQHCLVKGKVFEAMAKQCAKLQGWDTLQLFANPKAVKVAQSWPPKKLHLPCASTRIWLIEASKTAADQLPIGTFENYMVVIGSCSKTGAAPGDGFQNPFWLVPRTSEADDANMEVFPSIDVLKTKVIKLDKEIVLPVLRNSGKLAEGDELCLHTEKKDKAQQGEPLRAAPSKRLRTG
ncbi:unnamed protein product [Effrenium voratum]|uniref:Uncharacterized protein n=1 Tax=Effrenium voratum TaxID=2562239 RepID=A0AA36NK67_9DINO|nr:unnamed protein product [Effrenium voratum]